MNLMAEIIAPEVERCRNCSRAVSVKSYKICCPFKGRAVKLCDMSKVHRTIPVDDYVVDVLLRDLTGHDQQPSAFLVYLYLYTVSYREKRRPFSRSLREIAEATGLSKSAVQTALATLRRRELVSALETGPTSPPRLSVLRHWRTS